MSLRKVVLGLTAGAMLAFTACESPKEKPEILDPDKFKTAVKKRVEQSIESPQKVFFDSFEALRPELMKYVDEVEVHKSSDPNAKTIIFIGQLHAPHPDIFKTTQTPLLQQKMQIMHESQDNIYNALKVLGEKGLVNNLFLEGLRTDNTSFSKKEAVAPNGKTLSGAKKLEVEQPELMDIHGVENSSIESQVKLLLVNKMPSDLIQRYKSSSKKERETIKENVKNNAKRMFLLDPRIIDGIVEDLLENDLTNHPSREALVKHLNYDVRDDFSLQTIKKLNKNAAFVIGLGHLDEEVVNGFIRSNGLQQIFDLKGVERRESLEDRAKTSDFSYVVLRPKVLQL